MRNFFFSFLFHLKFHFRHHNFLCASKDDRPFFNVEANFFDVKWHLDMHGVRGKIYFSHNASRQFWQLLFRYQYCQAQMADCEIVTMWKMKNLLLPKNISSKQLFGNFVGKTYVFTKFLSKKCESKFLQFPHCHCATLCFFFNMRFFFFSITYSVSILYIDDNFSSNYM